MKKNFLFIAITAVLIAASIGTYQYFRSPSKAIDLDPVFTGSSLDFSRQFQSGLIHTNDVVQLEGEIIAHEEHSLSLIGVLLISRFDI